MTVKVQYQKTLFTNVYLTIFKHLSTMDQQFLVLVANGFNLVQMAVKMDKSRTYFAQYRRRMIEQQLIELLPDGSVEFKLPQFGEFVRQT